MAATKRSLPLALRGSCLKIKALSRRGVLSHPRTLARTKKPWSPEEGAKCYTAEGQEDPRGSLVNLGSGDRPSLAPVRHVQAIDKDTRETEIPKNLLGGGKLFDQRKERSHQAANELAEQLKRVNKMCWQRTQTGQSANQIVTLFLNRFPVVKPVDKT